MKRSAYIVATAFMLSIACAAHSKPSTRPRNVAAIVNGRVITTSQVTAVAIRMAGPAVLDQLVGNVLVDQEAKKRGRQATATEIDKAVDEIRAQIKPKSLDDAIRERHLTIAAFLDDIRVQVEIRKLLATKHLSNGQLAQMAPNYVKSLRASARVKTYIPPYSSGPAGVAADVNGQIIRLAQVSDLALRSAGQAAVNRLIINALVDKEAKKQGVTVSAADIDAKIAELRDQVRPKTLEESLLAIRMSMTDLRDIQRVRVEVEKLIGRTAPTYKMSHIRHIFVAVNQNRDEAAADEIMKDVQRELRAGASFADVAGRYSEDPGSNTAGGDLGIVTEKSNYDIDFLKAALALKAGEVSTTPVKTASGLELIEADSTGAAPPMTEWQAYADAAKEVQKQEVQAEMHDYIPTLRARAKITNYLNP